MNEVIILTNLMFLLQQIRARFTTTHVQYKVPETAIAIPSKLGRYGMSEVINHLLELDPPVPFDFMIDDTLIRTSLRKFVAARQINTEKVVSIEFMPVTSLGESEEVNCPAWIGALECPASGDHIFAGCYDGELRTIDVKSYDIISNVSAHDAPIRSISCWQDVNSGENFVATGSKDQTVKVWGVNGDGSVSLITTGGSSIASVECVKHWKHENMLLSADYSGNMFAYELNMEEHTLSEDSERRPSKKAKSRNGKSYPSTPTEIGHKFSIRAHTQAVSGMDISCDIGRVYTCSYDHSIKEWDMERQDCVASFVGSKVCTSVHMKPESRLLASSHPDGRVRIWDSRSRQDAVCSQVFPSAQSTTAAVHWISQVKWSPQNVNTFSTSNYNGEVSVWDIRSSVPVSTSEVHSGKVLCLDWLDSSRKGSSIKVVSGGSDCLIKSTEYS